MSGIDGIDKNISDAVAGRMSTFKTLFIALLVNLVVLVMFVARVFFKYSRQRRKVEEELASAKEMLDLVINSARSILVATDSSLSVKEWNAAAEKYAKIPSEEAVGKDLLELIPALSGYKSVIEKVYHSRHPAEFCGERVETEDGVRYYDMSIVYSSGMDGVVLQVDDVTERELREEQLLHSRKLKMVMALVGGLARNFNEALGNIVSSAASLKKALGGGAKDMEGAKDAADVIESAAEKADVMGTQLLALSEARPPKRESVGLNALLRRVMKICEDTLDKRVSLNAELYAGDAVVLADPRELEHAFLELCDNAVRAMTSEGYEEGVRDLTVSLELVEIDDAFRERQPLAFRSAYWAVRVADTGPGMDEGIVAKIFEPFFSTNPAATGLGLAIVNDIVTFHEGFIDVRSNPGNGTIVTIYLPERGGGDSQEASNAAPPSEEESGD
jgi:PAS domain S-box-containing protein